MVGGMNLIVVFLTSGKALKTCTRASQNPREGKLVQEKEWDRTSQEQQLPHFSATHLRPFRSMRQLLSSAEATITYATRITVSLNAMFKVCTVVTYAKSTLLKDCNVFLASTSRLSLNVFL
jgi:hypothetical protein